MSSFNISLNKAIHIQHTMRLADIASQALVFLYFFFFGKGLSAFG